MTMHGDLQINLNMDVFGVQNCLALFFIVFFITGNTRGIRCSIAIRSYFGYYYRLLIIIFILLSRLLVGVLRRVLTCVQCYAAPCRRISDTKC